VKTTRNDIAQDASAGYVRQRRARTTASFQHPANARCGRCGCGSQQRIAAGRGLSGRGHFDGRQRIRVGPLTSADTEQRYRARALGTQSRRQGRTARTHGNLRRSRAQSFARKTGRQAADGPRRNRSARARRTRYLRILRAHPSQAAPTLAGCFAVGAAIPLLVTAMVLIPLPPEFHCCSSLFWAA
jgi:hypothetical protein